MSKTKNNLAKNITTIKQPDPAGPFSLNEEHAAQIRTAEKEIVDKKCRLANLTIQQLQAAQDTVNAEQQLIDKISKLAGNFGITPENAGKWNFDTKTMTFSRTTQ